MVDQQTTAEVLAALKASVAELGQGPVPPTSRWLS